MPKLFANYWYLLFDDNGRLNRSSLMVSGEKIRHMVFNGCLFLASAIEAMGITLPYGSSTSAEKLEECFNAGIVIRNLLEKDIKPPDIIQKNLLKIQWYSQ
ncbi:hypothetical protein Glove_87g247 [Diversispora epigaea]|uniref:Uncharacterized protein n=1 Tax=Diversispora epigaea TaxID=1348612 RepID=A0A397JGR2_9GLOM|nr:hypothetical protein Glove_87g247 [Diversispora epigaea]